MQRVRQRGKLYRILQIHKSFLNNLTKQHCEDGCNGEEYLQLYFQTQHYMRINMINITFDVLNKSYTLTLNGLDNSEMISKGPKLAEGKSNLIPMPIKITGIAIEQKTNPP